METFSDSDRYRLILEGLVINRHDRPAVVAALNELASIREVEVHSLEHWQARVAAFARSLADDVLAGKTIDPERILEAVLLVAQR